MKGLLSEGPPGSCVDFFFFFWILFYFIFLINLFICLFLFLAVLGLRCSAQSFHCGGFSCCGAWALGAWASVVAARGLQSAGSVVVAHGLSCSATCGIFPGQGSNPCPLTWQADS